MNTPLKIVFADDDEDEHFIFKKVLSKVSIITNLGIVNNGQSLMEYLTKNIKQLPDAIFLDLNMPRKNGSECLVDIKTNVKLKHIPIIIYSTSFHMDILDLLYKHGAFHCIRKSTNTSEIKKLLTIVLKEILEDKNIQPSRQKFTLGF